MTRWVSIRRWFGAIWKPLLLFVFALIVIGIGASWHPTQNWQRWTLIGAAGFLLVVSTGWFSMQVGREHRKAEYHVTFARLVVSGAIVVACAVAFRWAPWEPVAFGGLGLGIVAFAAFPSELRRACARTPWPGPVLLGLAFVGAAGALVLLPANRDLLIGVLVALALAVVGTELHTEAWLQIKPRWPGWLSLVVGVVTMLVAVGLLLAAGTVSSMAAITVGAVLALVWMVAADNSSLVLVLVIVGALVWANDPGSAAPSAALAPAHGKPFFLVLGDSYISGEGAATFYDDTNTTKDNAEHTNECRRAPTAWPVLLAIHHPDGIPSRMLFLACSGAVTAQIRTQADPDPKASELVQYEAWQKAQKQATGVTPRPAFVLLSVGGNDAGFSTIGESCAGPGDCAALVHSFRRKLVPVGRELDATYHDVRKVVGDGVPVIVAPYPTPVTATGSCSARVLLDGTERGFVGNFVAALDRVVQSAAERAGFGYMYTEKNALAKVDLCAKSGTSGLNFIRLNSKAGSLWSSLSPLNWTHDSLHPNELGHEKIFDAAEQFFAKHPYRVLPAKNDAASRTVMSMAKILPYGDAALCTPHHATKCKVDGNGWLFDQLRQLARSTFLALVLAAIGAWLFVAAAMRWWRSKPWGSGAVESDPFPPAGGAPIPPEPVATAPGPALGVNPGPAPGPAPEPPGAC